MQEQLQTMPVKLPLLKEADIQNIHSFWAPIDDDKRYKELTHIIVKNDDDMQGWNMEMSERVAEQKKQQKHQKKVDSLTLFSKKTRARMQLNAYDMDFVDATAVTSKATSSKAKKGMHIIWHVTSFRSHADLTIKK